MRPVAQNADLRPIQRLRRCEIEALCSWHGVLKATCVNEARTQSLVLGLNAGRLGQGSCKRQRAASTPILIVLQPSDSLIGSTKVCITLVSVA